MYPAVRWPMQIPRVGIAVALVAMSDLHHELAVLSELQQLVVRDRLESRQAVAGTAVSSDPHEALIVDMDAVFPLGPFKAVARSAPGLDEIASRIEDHDRRRRHRGLLRPERPRAAEKPNIILRVDGEARLI